LIEEGYKGYNIVAFRGGYYGLGQGEGAFDVDKVNSNEYKRCFAGGSVAEVKGLIDESVGREAGLDRLSSANTDMVSK